MVTVAVSRMANAEGQTFDELFLAEYRRVVSIALRVLGDAHEAEDVAQEVFCDFYRKQSADMPYAAAWLHRAAVHTALNAIRSHKRRVRREADEAVRTTRLRPDSEFSLDPQNVVEIGERRREVMAALDRLPKKSAAVLALRYSGLSYAEVASALGVTTGQIGTLLRRAEKALRKEIERGTSG